MKEEMEKIIAKISRVGDSHFGVNTIFHMSWIRMKIGSV